MATVLITGASSGIGKITAERFMEEGHEVYGVARRLEKMRDLEDKGATTLSMDITKEEDIKRVVERIRNDSGGVDILVNNAGFAVYGAVEDTSIEDARYQFEVNIFGLARLTQQVLPGMRAKGAGTIINISSVGGKIYTPLGAWYHATKHALEGWSDALRLELKQFGIDVVIIEPGLIHTEFGDVMTEPLLERSGDTAYGELAHAVATQTEESYQEENSSPPSVVANAIYKAAMAKKPKTRYRVGKFAKAGVFARWLLSDRMFDAMLMSQTD